MFWNKKKTAPKESTQEETKKPLPCGDLYEGESVSQIALSYGKSQEEADELECTIRHLVANFDSYFCFFRNIYNEHYLEPLPFDCESEQKRKQALKFDIRANMFRHFWDYPMEERILKLHQAIFALEAFENAEIREALQEAPFSEVYHKYRDSDALPVTETFLQELRDRLFHQFFSERLLTNAFDMLFHRYYLEETYIANAPYLQEDTYHFQCIAAANLYLGKRNNGMTLMQAVLFACNNIYIQCLAEYMLYGAPYENHSRFNGEDANRYARALAFCTIVFSLTAEQQEKNSLLYGGSYSERDFPIFMP